MNAVRADATSDEAGFRLTFVDRAPLLWRFRAARCRWLEWREEIGDADGVPAPGSNVVELPARRTVRAEDRRAA